MRRSGGDRGNNVNKIGGCRVACGRGEGHALVAEGAREVEPLWEWDVRHADGYVRPKARRVCLKAG